MGGMGEEAARAWLLAALGEDEPPEEGRTRATGTRRVAGPRVDAMDARFAPRWRVRKYPRRAVGDIYEATPRACHRRGDHRFTHWNAFLAFFRPGFFRSTFLGSPREHPCLFQRSVRNAGA